MKSLFQFAAVVALTVALASTSDCLAQSGRSTGIGVQVGSPTGVTVKFVRPARVDYDFLAAWDLDDFLFLAGHALWERRVDDGSGDVDLRMFYGPGVFIGLRDNRNDDVVVGFSGEFGASLWFNQFEIFLQLMPLFELAPETDFHLGGGIGFRFHIPRN
jgi:hypothetical protein